MPNMPFMQDITGMGRLAETQQRIATNRRADMGALQQREMNKITLANARQEMLQRESDNVWKQGLTQHMQQLPEGSNSYLHQRDYAMKTGRMDFANKLDDQQFKRIGETMKIDPEMGIELANNTIGVTQNLMFANTPDEGQWSNMYTALDKNTNELVRMGQKPSGEWGMAPGAPEGGQKASPATDIDDYVADAESQYLIDNPDAKQMPPGERNDARREFKRAQAAERGSVVTEEKSTEGVERRASALIERGLLAAESSATIRRGIELLESVETGGVDAVALSVKRTLGVEGADEGELSQALGKAVLSQLRETFGAQFTQEEGNRLIRLEAGFGKSVANNKRLLEQSLRIVERTAKRALKAAEKRGDQDTVDDINDLLDFSLSMDEQKPTGQLPQGVSEDDITETMRANDMTREQVLAKLGGM